MSSPNPNNPTKIFSPTKQHQFNLQHAFSTLHTHCLNLLQNLSSFQSHLLSSLQTPNISLLNLNPNPNPSIIIKKNHFWASISETQMENLQIPGAVGGGAMSVEEIEDMLEQVPVYAVSNSEEEFVVASKDVNGQNLALLCFKKEDAESLLKDMKTKNRGLRNGSKVVPVPLNKVFQLKVEGVSFRLVPDFAEVINAVWERKMGGNNLDNGFWGVPVFQSKSLVVTLKDKSYRPAFFRMEDLEKTLNMTAIQEKISNNASKQKDIQVCVLEEMIQGMQDNSTSTWDDVIFIPPGFDPSVHEIISS